MAEKSIKKKIIDYFNLVLFYMAKQIIKQMCTSCKGTGIIQHSTYSGNQVVRPEETCPACGGDGKVKWGEIIDS